MSESNIRGVWWLIGLLGAVPSCIVTTPAPTQASSDDAGSDDTDKSTADDGEGDGGDEDGGADDVACSQSGASACDDILRGVCATIVACCAAPSASCASWASGIDSCMGYWFTVGYDCSSSQYVSTAVCADATKSCASDVSRLQCASVYGNTLQWSRSCVAFWQQFD